jgi:arginase
MRRLHVIGAPTSAGAYAPGQERGPEALRAAGLLSALRARGIAVVDQGDVPGFRWRVDPSNPRAMNSDAVATVVRAVADRVARSFADGAAVLVLGGDCTVEVGTVAGALVESDSVGLVYVDLDTDLNTPDTTEDGALDWMGVAHLLGLPGTIPAISETGPRSPLLSADQVVLFAAGNTTAAERRVIRDRGITMVRLAKVAADPARAAREVVQGWAGRFDCLLVHVDVDVLDYLDLPVAENVRRHRGLRFAQLVEALRTLVASPNWRALTVCEVNPDHGEADGSSIRTLSDGLADVLASHGDVDVERIGAASPDPM